MKRLYLFLPLFYGVSATNLVNGETEPKATIPHGALIIASEWLLDGDTPKGFTRVSKAGLPRIELENGCLKLSSARSSFGVKKEVKVSVKEYPYIHWSWQARMLPKVGDFRKGKTDDQAGQLYLLFARFRAMADTLMVGYLWDNEAPKGTSGTSTAWSKLKCIVLRDKTDTLGTWYEESRNVYEDYRRLFGEEPPNLTAVAVYINSQRTGSEAEILYGPLYFTREP